MLDWFLSLTFLGYLGQLGMIKYIHTNRNARAIWIRFLSQSNDEIHDCANICQGLIVSNVIIFILLLSIRNFNFQP